MSDTAALAGFSPGPPEGRPGPARRLDWSEGERPGILSWLAAGLSHVALAVAAVVLAFEVAPPPQDEREPAALSVEIVLGMPTDTPGGADTEADAAAPETTSPVEPRPLPDRFDVVLPNRVWPDVLRRYDHSWRAQQAAAGAPLGLPAGVRAALATTHYCRLGALGIGAELRRCRPLIPPEQLEARIRAVQARVAAEEARARALERSGAAGVRSAAPSE